MGISRNKKIVVATILSCSLIFSAIIWIGNKASLNNAPTLTLGDKKRAEASLEDSDNDGLLDWEEALWGTDPHNPDSDGDGTPDGREISMGQDPTKAGTESLFVTPQAASSTEPLDSTELFSRQLLSRLIAAKASGQDLPPEGVAHITNEFLASKFQYTRYSSSDLTITQDSSNEAVKKYVNSLGMILKAEADYRNADQVIFDFAQKADFSKLAELEVVSRSHTQVYEDLLALPVPRGLVAPHLALINSISATAEDLEALSEVTRGDAMILAVGLSQYQNNSGTTNETIRDLRDIVRSLGISFAIGEPGNILMN